MPPKDSLRSRSSQRLASCSNMTSVESDRGGAHSDQREGNVSSKGSNEDILKKMLSQINNLSQTVNKQHVDLTSLISSKTQSLKDEFTMQIGQLTNRILRVEQQVQELKEGKHFDTERCVMIYHMAQERDESEASLQLRVEEILSNGLELPGIEVVRVKRCFGEPGPVKVEFHNLNNKVEVLRAKEKLKRRRECSNLYMRSAKSHEERLLEINMKTLLQHLQIQDTFRFTGSGRMVYKDQENLTLGGPSNRSRGRGGYRGNRGRGRFQAYQSSFNPSQSNQTDNTEAED